MRNCNKLFKKVTYIVSTSCFLEVAVIWRNDRIHLTVDEHQRQHQQIVAIQEDIKAQNASLLLVVNRLQETRSLLAETLNGAQEELAIMKKASDGKFWLLFSPYTSAQKHICILPIVSHGWILIINLLQPIWTLVISSRMHPSYLNIRPHRRTLTWWRTWRLTLRNHTLMKNVCEGVFSIGNMYHLSNRRKKLVSAGGLGDVQPTMYLISGFFFVQSKALKAKAVRMKKDKMMLWARLQLVLKIYTTKHSGNWTLIQIFLRNLYIPQYSFLKHTCNLRILTCTWLSILSPIS